MKLAVRIVQTLLASLALLVIWGVAIEPRLILEHREERAHVPALPEDWHGREIALLADFQIGMWLGNSSMVARAIEDVVRHRPAAVLIAGDFIYTPTDEELTDFIEDLHEREFSGPVNEKIAEILTLLRPLTRSGIPTYAVLGNHDYGMYWDSSVKLGWVAQRLAEALERAGIKVLQNEAVPLALPSAAARDSASRAASLYLVGIGPEFGDEAHVATALASLPRGAPRIVLMHNPRSYTRVPPETAPLALAAHTHGGQIRIPGLPAWSWLRLAKDEDIRTDGWIAESYGAAGNRLYVNRGIGFSTVPLRINCPPEVTYIRLMPAPTRSH